MSIDSAIEYILHHLHIRLYRNNLPGAKGAYYARINNDAQLNIEDVAARLKTRGGYSGSYEDLVSHVRQFFDEMAYQLCDGYAVNTGYFSIHPKVNGFFRTPHPEKSDGGINQEEHSITFSFRCGEPLRRLAKLIEIVVDDPYAHLGLIAQFTDIKTGTVNGKLTPGCQFVVTGARIKVAGDDPACGVYFVSMAEQGSLNTEQGSLDEESSRRAEDSRRFKVLDTLAGNTGGKVIGIVPDLPQGMYLVEIKTQYTIGGIPLKTPRTITSEFTLRVV